MNLSPPESARVARVLVIGHALASAPAVGVVRGVWPEADVDVLAYGRAAASTPTPEGARALELPSRAAGAPRFLGSLRAVSYDVAVVAQPHLAVSRARGALLALAVASRAGSLCAFDTVRGKLAVVSHRFAVMDGLRFAAFHAAGWLLAQIAASAVDRAARRPTHRPIRGAPSADGTVVYLRTDLELALTPVRAGGSLAHTDGILRALERRGNRVELWTTGEMSGMPGHIRCRRLPVLLRANVPWEAAELASGLLQAMRPLDRPDRPAFVYQRYSLNNVAGLALARRWHVPLIVEANASEVAWRTQWSSLQFPRLARATERLLLRSADRIAVVSENAAADLRVEVPEDGRLRVVPNGVEIERFSSVSPRPLPFGAGAFVIAFSGLFYPWHGVRYLAEAFSDVYAKRPNARLLLVGDGEEAPLVRSLLAPHVGRGTVHLTGLVPREEVPGYLAAADVLVSPHAAVKDFIGSPIKLWEYMASGRAIVATRVGQLGEVLRGRETGLLIAPDDRDALVNALVELHDDPALRNRLGEAAAEEARRLHSWDARLAATLAEAA